MVATFSEAIRNVGQLEVAGNLTQPTPGLEAPVDRVKLDPREVPWELREE